MSKKPWFESWFNSKYYHILYQKRDAQEADDFIQNLTQYLPLPSNANCLDLACGKGRHSFFLSQLGFRVTGLDLAENSIQWAKEHYQSNALDFFVHDMRLPYKTNHYDVVFNFFTSFGYFDDFNDNLLVFKSVNKQLKPNGLFVLDYLNTQKAVDHLVREEEKNIQHINFQIKKWVENKKIFKQIRLTDGGKEQVFTEEVAELYLQDFALFANQSGFELIETFGDYDLNPFHANQSDRLILIFQKQ